jgi:hypothetical protein
LDTSAHSKRYLGHKIKKEGLHCKPSFDLAKNFSDFNYLTIGVFDQKVERLFATDFVFNAFDLNLQ